MYSVGMHTLKAVEQVRADKVLRLTMLLHDVAKPQMKTVDADGVAHFKMHDVKGAEVAKRILKRLKFDNDTLGKVTKLVQYHDYCFRIIWRSEKRIQWRRVNICGRRSFQILPESSGATKRF